MRELMLLLITDQYFESELEMILLSRLSSFTKMILITVF